MLASFSAVVRISRSTFGEFAEDDAGAGFDVAGAEGDGLDGPMRR